MILQEKESDFKKQLLENNINQDYEKTNEIEGLRKTNFKLQKKLLEIKTYQTKVESLDMSYESLKRTNKDLMLKMEKNRNIIDRMIIQMKTKTKRIVTLQKDNSFISSKLLEVETKNTNKQRTIEKINVELKKSSEESSKLTRMIQSMGDKSSNALENALSNKLDLLEQKYSKKDNLSKRLEQQNVELRSQLKKYKNTLGGLLKLELPVDDTNITDTNADNVMDSDEEVSNVSEVVAPTNYLPNKSYHRKRNNGKRKSKRR
jgi:chromosome segregation ATPase